MSQLINEAFKELKGIEDLDEELFSFDKKGITALNAFLDRSSDPVLDVIDPLASSEEEIQPSYTGNVICRCCVCKQLIYKNPEDVVVDEETQRVNVDEECPHCCNVGGFEVVGQVEPYVDKDKVKVTVDDDEVEVEETEEDDTEEEVVTESLNEEEKTSAKPRNNTPYFDAIRRALGVGYGTASRILNLYLKYSPDAFNEYPDPKEFEEFVKDDVFDMLDWAEDYSIPGIDEIRTAIEFKESLNEDLDDDVVDRVEDILDKHNIGIISERDYGNGKRYTFKVDSDTFKAFSKEVKDLEADGILSYDWVQLSSGPYEITIAPYGEIEEEDEEDFIIDENGNEITSKEEARKWLRKQTAEYSNTHAFPANIKKILNALIDKFGNTYFWFKEGINEDTVKTKKGWVNKGKAGTHGTFRTKKAADAQRKAMFASGWKSESLKEDLDPAIVAKMGKESFINYVVTRKGWTEEEAEEYLKTYFSESFEDEYSEVSDIVLEIYPHETRDFLYTNDDQARSHLGKLKETGGKDKKDILWGYALLRRQSNRKFRVVTVEATEDMYETDVKEVTYDYLGNMNAFYEPFREASDEKLIIKVTEDDVHFFDEETGDIIIDKSNFVGKDIKEGDYITVKFTDENEDTETQDYKFVRETEDGFQLEWIGTESLNEDFQKATVETGESILSMESDDSGKVTVTSEPRKIEESGEEMIVPVSDEVQAEIEENNAEEEVEETEEVVDETVEEEEEPTEETETDIAIDEFEESYFSVLGKKYLQEVYNNVSDFTTTKGAIDGNKIKLEGVITFNSGKKAKTNFIFEGKEITKKGKVRFLGENTQITPKRNAFTLSGTIKQGKLLAESLNYNYRAKDMTTGKIVREYGTVKR